MQDDSFYLAFEDRHRGTRELIINRLRVYLPFIRPLKDIYDECPLLDLGCGRGEWLELSGEAGFLAHGVDLDEGMLSACRERGFSVETQDALTALKQLPDHSLAVVSGFHLAEHLQFDTLQELVKEALRVLKPAGLLIFETPNPENIIVGTSDFYLDPTHHRPLPPQLLSFLTEYAGFFRTKILRLNESPSCGGSNADLMHVLSGASPDYAVVAQSGAASVLLERFDATFEKEYGLMLHMLARQYDAEIQTRFSKIEGFIIQIESRASAAESRASAAESRASAAESRMTMMESSRSWKITAPLRRTLQSARSLMSIARSVEKSLRNLFRISIFGKLIILPTKISLKLNGFIKTLFRLAVGYVASRSRLKKVILHVLDRCPTAKSRLIRILFTGTASPIAPGLEHLTPRARQIYDDLTAAIELAKKDRT